jgi:hypothetical protein
MAKEIINNEDKGEVTSSRMDESICSIFYLDKTCLFLDLGTFCLRVITVSVPIALISICYAMCLSC